MFEQHQPTLEKNRQEFNAYVALKSKELGLSMPAAVVNWKNNDSYEPYSVEFEYQHCGAVLEAVVQELFSDFNANIAKEQTIDKKIELIADLFFMLEILHPFIDGQGRTDLILLNKLLSQHGANPAILNQPYVSTGWLRDPWIAYLKEGMALWQMQLVGKRKIE